MTKNPEVKTRICLDWDMVGYSPSFSESYELEYWFGPKYSDDISTIQPGLTVHKSEEFERLYHGISATEFVWKITENTHEFELEELKEDQAPTMKDTYGCRYIHSIYRDDLKTFEHFDGAIRSYDSELYFERIDKKMTEFGRRSQYKKLFRIDGKLDLKYWKSLSTNYMQGNPLIYEYFGLEKPTANHILKKESKTVKEELVPYSINEGDGLRLMVSYHGKNEENRESHIVTICDVLTFSDGSKKFLEYDVIEIKKALSRHGKELMIPDDVLLGFAEDLYWNIPCIFHGANDPSDDIRISILALKEIIIALTKKKVDKVVSFTLAWNMEDKEVRLGVLGHVNDLLKWFNTYSSIPMDHAEFNKWLDVQSKYLNELGVKNPDSPLLEELSQFDGVMYMKRRIVGEEFNLKLDIREKEIGYTFEIPPSQEAVLTAFRAGEIVPVMSCIAEKMICSKTNSDYWISPYSKILDEGVHCRVEKFDFMGAYWSDKPSLKRK